MLKSNSKSNTNECFVRKLQGYPIEDGEYLDELFAESQQAMTGLIVDEYSVSYEDFYGNWIHLTDKDLGEKNQKLKIYACDEEPDFGWADEDDYLRFA